jgi:hypothetical protein
MVGLVLFATGGSAFGISEPASAVPARQHPCGDIIETAAPTWTKDASVRDSQQAHEPLTFFKTVNALAGIFRKPRNYFDPETHACFVRPRGAAGARGAQGEELTLSAPAGTQRSTYLTLAERPGSSRGA